MKAVDLEENFTDVETEEVYRGRVIFGDGSAEARFCDQDGCVAGSVLIEVRGNQLVVYCWGPEDVDEPSQKMIVVDDLRAAQQRKEPE